MGHRPMYCSNNDGDDCTKKDGIVSIYSEVHFDLFSHSHNLNTRGGGGGNF